MQISGREDKQHKESSAVLKCSHEKQIRDLEEENKRAKEQILTLQRKMLNLEEVSVLFMIGLTFNLA